MALSLDDLTTPLTRQQVQAAHYQTISILGVNVTLWKPAAVVKTMITAASVVGSAFSAEIANIAKLGFLELSQGDWLTQVAHYVYGVDKIAATFAAGEVTLTNHGGGVYTLDPGDLIVHSPVTDKAYRNTTTWTLGASTSLTIPIVAIEAGTASNAAAGTVTELTTPLLGVTCTNALTFAGADAESDANLRARCAEKLGSLSPFGPWDAYTFAARNAVRADGSSIGVNRIRLTRSIYGVVDVYVATATGGVTAGPDLTAVDEAIQRRAAPLAITAITHSATQVDVTVDYEVWLYSTNRTEQQIKDTVIAALAALVAATPIGGNVVEPSAGRLFASAIRGAIIGALPEIFDATVTTPAGDVTLNIYDVAVLGTVTCTSLHQVPTPDGTVN